MLEGRCGCGAVTYQMHTKPMFVHCCHCKDCQRQTGSAFVLNAIIEADRVTFEGPVNETTLPTPSGKGQIITRCAECGVAVFSAYLVRQGKLRYVRVGTLDDPDSCPPDVHIFTSSKLDWMPLPADVPVFENFYEIPKVWPESSLARWRELFGS
jgi:hypothetical protein